MKERQQIGLEERLAGLFTPDTLLPSQYFDRMRRRSEFDGERRLMIAVLEDAVDVYRKQVGAQDARGKQLFREAEEWIEDTDRTWLFSFENICDVLDIDATYVRRGLHALKRRGPGALRPKVVTLHPDHDALRKASGS
jgi:hypothetical protein